MVLVEYLLIGCIVTCAAWAFLRIRDYGSIRSPHPPRNDLDARDLTMDYVLPFVASTIFWPIVAICILIEVSYLVLEQIAEWLNQRNTPA